LKSGILDSSGEQIYSYSSWANLSSEIATAKSYVTAAGTKDDDGFLPGKYAVTGTSEYTYNGVTYTYETFDEDDNKLSEIQKTIYDYNDSNALQNATLTSIDDSEAYESFDDAINILDSLDKRKYTDEGIAKIEELRASLIGSDGSVYKELTDKEKEAYKTATGNDITLDSIKVTAQKETDPKTADILNSITDLNNIDNGFVKEFTAELTVQDENRNVISTSTDTAYYGNKFNFDLGDDVDDDSSIVWSVSLYDDVTKRNDDDSLKSLKDYANVTASSKWAYPGKTISRIADSNVSITAMVTGASESTDDTVKVEI
jgi:hypothetical protein